IFSRRCSWVSRATTATRSRTTFRSSLRARSFLKYRRFCRRSRRRLSGPFVPEVPEGVFPGPEVVDRTSINAWLTPNFVKAVDATGRKRLVIAGLWTRACAAFNVIDGLRRGYEG